MSEHASPEPHGDPPPARARQLIEALGLVPHPERGFYAETYRAPARVFSSAHAGERSASTAIYFLICEPERSTFLHRLKSDEVFHLYEGGPLDVLRLFPDRSWDVARLGLAVEAGERPQLLLPAGTWFGTELAPGTSHCLLGCTVAPGFEFQDFELDSMDLRTLYPGAAERIARLQRTRGQR
jgi:predicted cupin superfamily sugar epimerase